jgi:hypothetical protein
MYKLNGQNKKSFLNYRHNVKRKNQLSKLQDINSDDDDSISANEIIARWSAFAKGAFVGEFKESSLACWEGHYEQFGRLMYEFYAISENRSVRLKKYSVEFQNFFPLVENLKFIPKGPSSSEDKTYYRIWFKMLGHPDFSSPIINDFEPDTYATGTFFLTKVYCKINVQLILGQIKSPEIGKSTPKNLNKTSDQKGTKDEKCK